jgi:hypothetical protein
MRVGRVLKHEVTRVPSPPLGPIPTHLGSCTNLQTLAMDHNCLTGELGLFELVDASPCHLRGKPVCRELRRTLSRHAPGPIPTHLGRCNDMRLLLLDNNCLMGKR